MLGSLPDLRGTQTVTIEAGSGAFDERTDLRIILVGGSGTIGRRLAPELAQRHEVVVAGRNSGDVRVDIANAESIEAMYREVPGIDAVVGIAASGALDEFAALTEEDLLDNLRGKFFGQASLVLIGQRYVNPGGSFTLASSPTSRPRGLPAAV